MNHLNRGILIIFFFVSFVFTLIFNSFALTNSYLEMTNLYEQTQEAADMAHELNVSNRVVNQIGMNKKDEELYLYNKESFKETFINLMKVTQKSVDTYIDDDNFDNDYIRLEYRSGNKAYIRIAEMNTDNVLIAFNYKINVIENINYEINRSFELDWDVRRKAGEYK